MPQRFSFTFSNPYVGQRFVVDDLINTAANPIWSGHIETGQLSPRIYCTPAADGPGWGKVAVYGQTTAPATPVVKEITKDGDHFTYAP